MQPTSSRSAAVSRPGKRRAFSRDGDIGDEKSGSLSERRSPAQGRWRDPTRDPDSSSSMRFRRKVDANQKAIVEVLRSVGATVVLLHAVGGGIPDLLVGYRQRTWLLEVKRIGRDDVPGKRLTGGRSMTATAERQKAFHDAWRGGPVSIVRSADEALRLISSSPSSPETADAEAPAAPSVALPPLQRTPPIR